MGKEKFSENPKIKVTEKKSKSKKVRIHSPQPRLERGWGHRVAN
jgi:hypothetical protein